MGVLFWIATFLSFSALARGPFDSSLPARIPCRSKIVTMLNEWGATEAPFPAGQSSLFPTRKVGTWIELSNAPESPFYLRRISATDWTEVQLDPKTCQESKREGHRKLDEKLLSDAFTDADLERKLRSGRAGLVFAWSPYMPYSVQAIPNVQKVAKELGLELSIVMDPKADPETANAVLSRWHVGDCAKCTRPLESMELLFRNMTQHFPTLLIYSKKGIDRQTFPSYDSTEGYRVFVKRRLSS